MNWYYFGGAALYAVMLVATFWMLVALEEHRRIWSFYRPDPERGGYVTLRGKCVERRALWCEWAWRIAMVPVVFAALPLLLLVVMVLLFVVDVLLKRLMPPEKHRWLQWKLGLEGKPVKVTGGDGSSKERAVVIDCDDSRLGIRLEYNYILKRYGPRDLAWTRDLQMLVRDGGRHYDVITIALQDGEKKTLWFDITAFVGRW